MWSHVFGLLLDGYINASRVFYEKLEVDKKKDSGICRYCSDIDDAHTTQMP